MAMVHNIAIVVKLSIFYPIRFSRSCNNLKTVFLRGGFTSIIKINRLFIWRHIFCYFLNLSSRRVNLVQDGIGFSHRQSPPWGICFYLQIVK